SGGAIVQTWPRSGARRRGFSGADPVTAPDTIAERRPPGGARRRQQPRRRSRVDRGRPAGWRVGMPAAFALGLDFGTASVRALLADPRPGEEIATASFSYPAGDAGVLTDDRDPEVARQHPGDHLAGAAATVQEVLAQVRSRAGFDPQQIVGI